MYQFFVIQSQTREALRGHDDFKIHEALFGKRGGCTSGPLCSLIDL